MKRAQQNPKEVFAYMEKQGITSLSVSTTAGGVLSGTPSKESEEAVEKNAGKGDDEDGGTRRLTGMCPQEIFAHCNYYDLAWNVHSGSLNRADYHDWSTTLGNFPGVSPKSYLFTQFEDGTTFGHGMECEGPANTPGFHMNYQLYTNGIFAGEEIRYQANPSQVRKAYHAAITRCGSVTP